MANEKNLIPIRDSETARRLQQRSSKKQKENTAKRKLIREGLEEQIGMRFDDYIKAILDKAVAGDTKAWELVRDTIGEKPVEKVEAKTDTDLNINIKVIE